MKRILVTAALAGLGAFSALAADLPVRTYTKAPPMMAAPYSWTGFYLGVNVGGSVGRSRTTTTDPAGTLYAATTYLSAAGAIGGGQIGYNWQTSTILGQTVFGLEADFQGSGQKTSTCTFTCSADGALTETLDQKINWFGTVRGRVGIANGPVLGYVTGGYAYANVNTSGSISGAGLPSVPFALSQTRGGYVLGSGVEASLGGNWTGKIEYLYLDLGTQTQLVNTTGNAAAGFFGNPATVSSRVRDNIFRGGVNYRFGGNSTYVEPVKNWGGLYVGGNFGSLVSRNSSNYVLGPGAGIAANNQSFTLVPDGYEFGGQIGYNWQASALVFGVEADFQGTTSKDNKTCLFSCVTPANGGAAYNQKTPYFGTVRGRLGYSVGSTLFYGTAGWAYGQTKTDLTITGLGASPQQVSFKHGKGGYVVGGGIESPFTLFGLLGPAWTIKSEYLFVDLGSTTDVFRNTAFAGPTTDTFTTRTREHISRTGINYHFNTPVVAKY